MEGRTSDSSNSIAYNIESLAVNNDLKHQKEVAIKCLTNETLPKYKQTFKVKVTRTHFLKVQMNRICKKNIFEKFS